MDDIRDLWDTFQKRRMIVHAAAGTLKKILRGHSVKFNEKPYIQVKEATVIVIVGRNEVGLFMTRLNKQQKHCFE